MDARTLLAIFVLLLAAGHIPVVAQPVPKRIDQITAPKTPDDYPFDPPEFRIPYEATYYTEMMQKLQKQARYLEAEPYARKALLTMLQLPGNDQAIAVCRMNLADLCCKLDKLEEAETLYRQCWRTFTGPRPMPRGLLNDNDPAALCLFRLAGACRRMGRVEEAEQMCLQGLAIVEARLGKGHAQMATGLLALGESQRDQGKLDLAEQMFHQSVNIRMVKLGNNHLETAASLAKLGEVLLLQKRYREAEKVLNDCLKIRANRLGPNPHPDLADTLTDLGEICQATGRYAQAAQLNSDALDIRVACFGLNHPDVATSLDNLAAAHQMLGLPCKDLQQRSRLIREQLSNGHR